MKNKKNKVLDMEVLPDHVHLLLDVNPKIGVFSVVNKIKGYTSRKLREEFPSLRKRLPTLWTHSKFISSVGAVTLEVVKRYKDILRSRREDENEKDQCIQAETNKGAGSKAV